MKKKSTGGIVIIGAVVIVYAMGIAAIAFYVIVKPELLK